MAAVQAEVNKERIQYIAGNLKDLAISTRMRVLAID